MASCVELYIYLISLIKTIISLIISLIKTNISLIKTNISLITVIHSCIVHAATQLYLSFISVKKIVYVPIVYYFC